MPDAREAKVKAARRGLIACLVCAVVMVLGLGGAAATYFWSVKERRAIHRTVLGGRPNPNPELVHAYLDARKKHERKVVGFMAVSGLAAMFGLLGAIGAWIYCFSMRRAAERVPIG